MHPPPRHARAHRALQWLDSLEWPRGHQWWDGRAPWHGLRVGVLNPYGPYVPWQGRHPREVASLE